MAIEVADCALEDELAMAVSLWSRFDLLAKTGLHRLCSILITRNSYFLTNSRLITA